ncbi:MAG: hypothetical protein AMJ53_15245 [Gammaproteobacteria bacterium SG8_11]|nr:MAG: hypothetical protein AMJ53_15245 [Gammaproteobacteria bacterium SG8_11]
MADTKASGLTENTAPAAEDLIYTIDDPSGTPASRKTTLANLLKFYSGLTEDTTPTSDAVLAYLNDVGGTPAARKMDIADLAVALTEVIDTDSQAAAYDLDWAAYTYVELTLTGDVTITFSNVAAGRSVTLCLIQDGTGGRSITWPGTVDWPNGEPTLQGEAAEVTYVTLFVRADGSTVEGFTANAAAESAKVMAFTPGGRLTLTTGTPVTTSDVTAATTLYYTPYIHDVVRLYNTGDAAWETFQFTERSIAVPATTDTNYDVFLYNNSGTLTLSLTAWTNDTTRATAVTRQNGVLVKSGAADYLYLGTVRTTGSSGEIDDSVTSRFVWNNYNQVERLFSLLDATGHTYDTATWRAWNNSTTHRVKFVIGEARYIQYSINGGAKTSATTGSVGIGPALDATNTADQSISNNEAATVAAGCTAAKAAAAGYHYIQAVERGDGAGGTTSFVYFYIQFTFLG